MKEKLTFGKGIIVGAVSVVILLFLFFGIYLVTQKMGESKAYRITTTPMTDLLPEKPIEVKNQANTENDEKTENNIEQGDTSKDYTNKAIEEESQAITLTLVQENSWGDDTDKKYVQWKVTLTNNSTKTVNGWKVNIKLPTEAKIDQYWNFTGTLKEGNYSITPASYNQSVEASQSIEFGFILINGGDITSDDYQVYADNQKAVMETENDEKLSATDTVVSVETKVLTDDTLPLSQDDWLYVKENKIVDKDGKEVWITGINWFGYNTGTNTFDGLWTADLNSSIEAIADHGFNLIRLPISSELILNWKQGIYPTANFNQAVNSYLVELNSLEILDYIVNQCHKNGIKIMFDIHSAKTDSMGHMYNMWYKDDISIEDYLTSLAYLAKRYKTDDTVVAYDLKNEPHGKPSESPRAIWNDSTVDENWKNTAEEAALAVLNENPNALVMIEGIEIYPKNIKTNSNYTSTKSDDYYFSWWGGNLRGVKDYPIELGEYNNKVVYSPHDYGPSVYKQPWFEGEFTYESLNEDYWQDSWFYIYENKTAPLLIGEWGGYMSDENNLRWMTYLRQLIVENKLHHTFWCFNANSGDTGGLVGDDFATWDKEKYEFVKEALWQYQGKFVGLDHEIPLGSNGITLTMAK